MDEEIMITLHNPSTGQSESVPVPKTLTVAEVSDLGKALLGLDDNSDNSNSNSNSNSSSSKLVVAKDGRPLHPPTETLSGAGVQNGDLLAFLRTRTQPQPQPQPAASINSSSGGSGGGGGLDFSSLLGGGASSSSNNNNNNNNNTGLDFSSLLPGGASAAMATAATATTTTPTPVYYPGMSFEDAMESNPHPKAIVSLLRKHNHLFKEFNYHMPHLAQQISASPSYEAAVELWRKEMVSHSIRSAAATSQTFHKERNFRQRLLLTPNDSEAKEYFEKKDAQRLVNEQYMQAMQEYPESMGKVLMLYINAKINSHPLQAFVDSGAQMTIMSKTCAQRCGILHLLDTRFHGMAVGVGTGKILGRIHIVQLQIGDYHFPCSVTIMDDATLPRAGNGNGNNTNTNNGNNNDDAAAAAKPKDMDLLLGLDMLKRFNCSIDLMDHKLKFRLGGSTLETPFLHEKDLDESKGGTKGFDATRANRELEDAQRKHREEQQQQQQQEQEQPPKNDKDDTDATMSGT